MVRGVILQGMSFPLIIHLVTSFTLNAEKPPMSSMKTVLEPFVLRQSTIVPLGDWTTEDYTFMCNKDFSVS